MTRLETLKNRKENLIEVRDFYTKSVKIGGKLFVNKRSGQFMRVITAITKEIRTLEN